MINQPTLSIVIPIYPMKGGAEFLWRSINMLTKQTFKDFEIIITQDGKMAENTNSGIKRAKGKLIKILFMDDILSSENSLQEIVDNFTDEDNWIITGCDTNPHPYWTDDITSGNNKLGSPSCLTFRNGLNMYFDENMSWLLDCDFYKRMYDKYGEPKILDSVNVNLGIGDHQVTNIMPHEEKLAEHNYMNKKYENN
jgi:glycosyltransferase involved in cell wall biosynthesis